jgi:hypothetical protein
MPVVGGFAPHGLSPDPAPPCDGGRGSGPEWFVRPGQGRSSDAPGRVDGAGLRTAFRLSTPAEARGRVRLGREHLPGRGNVRLSSGLRRNPPCPAATGRRAGAVGWGVAPPRLRSRRHCSTRNFMTPCRLRGAGGRISGFPGPFPARFLDLLSGEECLRMGPFHTRSRNGAPTGRRRC